MPLERRDLTRLVDMLHYARVVAKIIHENGLVDYVAFDANAMAKLAVVRCVEVIGEAGHHVSPAVQAALPTVPWPMMWGMRNRLIHDYGNTNYRIVHWTVVQELPGLAATLETFLVQHGHTA
jgi:uncharacterized protein with HEPN domain